MISASKILVTGATGMVGRALVPKLLDTGHQVTCLIRTEATLSAMPWANSVQSIQGDLLNPEDCTQATTGVDVVIHLAGRAHTRDGAKEFFSVNTKGTENLVTAAIRSGVRHFIFISTAAVYGPQEIMKESGPFNPTTPYGESKLEAERILTRMAQSASMEFTILRPSVIYGQHDRGNVLRMMKAVDRGWFPLIDGGRALKSMTHVDNVVDVILQCIDDPRCRNEIFNVSDPTPYSMGDLANLFSSALERKPLIMNLPKWVLRVPVAVGSSLFRLFGRTPPVTWDDVEVLTSDAILDVSKLSDTLGYESRVDLAQGLEEVVRWYRQ